MADPTFIVNHLAFKHRKYIYSLLLDFLPKLHLKVTTSSLLVSFYWWCILTLSFLCSGVDFKVKMVTIGGKKLKLAIWDTGYLVVLKYFMAMSFFILLFISSDFLGISHAIQLLKQYKWKYMWFYVHLLLVSSLAYYLCCFSPWKTELLLIWRILLYSPFLLAESSS